MVLTSAVLMNRLLARARLKHLQVLVKVAELGSFSKAGEAIGMTQPAITHVVSDLESLLGVELFTRHARGVAPTGYCDELLPAANRVIESVGQGVEGVVARLEQATGSIRIGATAGAIGGLLADALAVFSEAHPDVAVQLVEERPDELARRMRRSEFDLVGCRQPAIVPAGWDYLALREDRLVVVCGAAHPLASRRRLRFAQLARETWLAAPVSTVGRRMLDELLVREGMTPRFAWISTIAVPSTWALLKRRRLLTLIPFSVVRALVEAKELVVLPLDETFALGPLGVLTPAKPDNPATGLLTQFLIAASR